MQIWTCRQPSGHLDALCSAQTTLFPLKMVIYSLLSPTKRYEAGCTREAASKYHFVSFHINRYRFHVAHRTSVELGSKRGAGMQDGWRLVLPIQSTEA